LEDSPLDVSQHVEPDAADMLDIDVPDIEVADPAIGAVGHDLDAIALQAVALDREVRQRQRTDIDPGGDVDLDDRSAACDLRQDLGAAEVDPQRPLERGRDFYE